ncbi:MAG TPA: bifunctional glutamate N-acetyltransferase/amino-acid acetyltransferase ArgJ [Salinisphaeraceae bacterium]|nr:bifunctional glutamate N-acetyltransferase/amino-acid acetyltransferase ArgJ [Salinisphaeraceae bacterium]
MAVNLAPPGALATISGARWATAAAAIKQGGRDDIAVLALPEHATVAGVLTRNAFAAAPVALVRAHLAQARPRALLVNSGNANAGTGAAGLADARQLCAQVAQALGVETAQVLPFSTGVIGERLPLAQMQAALSALTPGAFDEAGWLAAAKAIMTTDTVAKAASRSIEYQGADGRRETVALTGIAKGAGMIRPDMATMLAFIATDAQIEQPQLQQLLHAVTAESFNAISVDGDTSTNDACMLCATGQGPTLAPAQPGWQEFAEALASLAQELAQAIVRDAEGATRFITLAIQGARDSEAARAVAFTIAHSPLVKTACFAGDPNWGRILAALGRAPLAQLDIDRVNIALDDVAVIRNGEPAAEYREAAGARVMAQSEFTLHVDLGQGDAAATIWTCDLSYDYVRINAEYRS